MANKKNAEEIRIRRVPIMMTEEEYETLKRRAEDTGMNVSEYIRFKTVYGGKRKVGE